MAQDKTHIQRARQRKIRAQHKRLLTLERTHWAGNQVIAGLDEAGAGPLAGPVTAACVVLDPNQVDRLVGVNDSKQLTAKRRTEFSVQVKEVSLGWAIAHASVEEIDDINIREAGILAMERALFFVMAQIGTIDHLLVDARHLPHAPMTQDALIRGDSRSLSIAAASILAKVERDEYMTTAAQQFPDYGFERHKGYGSKAHLEALHRHGVTPLHRRSFAPVRAKLLQVEGHP